MPSTSVPDRHTGLAFPGKRDLGPKQRILLVEVISGRLASSGEFSEQFKTSYVLL